jgi:hypothetical protein
VEPIPRKTVSLSESAAQILAENDGSNAWRELGGRGQNGRERSKLPPAHGAKLPAGSKSDSASIAAQKKGRGLILQRTIRSPSRPPRQLEIIGAFARVGEGPGNGTMLLAGAPRLSVTVAK